MRKDSFGHMVVHFIGDYFHYDNKFWTTFKALITKPGQVTLDYIEGRRARYLNPIQLYIFVVTVMVLLTIGQADTGQDNVVQTPQPGTAQPAASSPADSLQEKQADSEDAANNIGLHSGPTGQGVSIGPWTPTEPTVSAYDSVQQALPEAERDGIGRGRLDICRCFRHDWFGVGHRGHGEHKSDGAQTEGLWDFHESAWRDSPGWLAGCQSSRIPGRCRTAILVNSPQ